MRGARWLFLIVLLAALAVGGSVLAEDDAADERARQLLRDQHLIQDLVDSGVRLAAEDDPLRRADHCNRLAERLGKEIKLAITKKDSKRAAQFGKHMQALLVRGVAGNLAVVKNSLGPDSPREREAELARLGKQSIGFTQDLQNEVNSHPELEQDQRTLQDIITDGQKKITQAIQGKDKQ